MMFEAILFLAGALLFFLAALFFVFLWQDRVAIMRRRAELETQIEAQQAALKEQKIDLDILEHELQVWAQSLEQEQAALAEAREELRMLTPPPPTPEEPSGRHREEAGRRERGGTAPAIKNVKQAREEVKLPK